jgi:hypothetical protein
MDLIHVFENALDDSTCDKIIEMYKNSDKKEIGGIGNLLKSPEINNNIRSVKCLSMSDGDTKLREICDIVAKKLQLYIRKYIDEISDKNTKEVVFDKKTMMLENFTINEYNMGDFYTWHHDDGVSTKEPRRILSFVWYLNTLDYGDGGYTEFACGKKIKPQKGSLLIFPSSWCYVHRGQRILKNVSKYICTTWLTVPPSNILSSS